MFNRLYTMRSVEEKEVTKHEDIIFIFHVASTVIHFKGRIQLQNEISEILHKFIVYVFTLINYVFY